MKLIDLLNKIANDEEVPKYVQYYNMLKDKIDIMMVCKENIFYKLDQLEIQLNSRIEPVEEEKKIPEIKEILEESIYNNYDLHTSEKKKLLDYITNLQEKNNNLKEDFKRHIERINELTERIDKAIEYIKQYKELDFSDLDLLTILQGSKEK